MTISQIAGPVRHQGTTGRSPLFTRRGAEATTLHAPSETYCFVAPRRGRVLTTGALLASVVLTISSAVAAATHPSLLWFILTGLAAVTAVALWAALQARVPQTVTLKNSVIEIRSNGSVERFDLVDPSVEVLARDGEIAFRCYDGRFAVVRSRDVEWSEFSHVVMHYQQHADRYAAERQRRYTR